jgi:hypothetical protein
MGMCYFCVHLGENNDDDKMTCAAYPDGIPDLIIDAKRDHRTRLPGDNGITFEPEDDVSQETLDRVFSLLP